MEDKDYYKIVTEYFENNFINNEKNKIKQKSFWLINNRVIKDISTTTNSYGGFHRHLNSKVSRKNTSLIKIIDILEREERMLKIITQNIKSGYKPIKKSAQMKKNIVLNYIFYSDLEFF
ncbi:hypothetical protein DMUE_6037 [Dictyocoela muelleri]|nr:hypothetical protein DMUE_6037 [Dictyocoela muelleri]